MRASFNLSSHWLSGAFWETVFERGYESIRAALPVLHERHQRCEGFRARADYNTGSINLASGLCLYALCRHFQVERVAEVGTFLGKSTSSMALALGHNGPDGVIHTCDKDNACFEPWPDFGCRVRSFPKTTSTGMLRELAKGADKMDLFYFDGRLQPDDIPLVTGLSHPGTLYAFDDFIGIEKGVVNAVNLRPALRRYILIEPCEPALLRRYGVEGRSLTAAFFNTDNLLLTNQ